MSLSKNKTPHPRLVEAARYALMRRLAPAIRHDMAGALQPISMIAAMLERRLQAPAPDMAQLAKNSRDIGVLSREAASTCMNLMTWLTPRENDLVPLGEGVQESVALLTTELSFKGFGLRNDTGDVQVPVQRGLLRGVVMASLIALTDAGTAPADVVLRAQTLDGGRLRLELSLVASDGESPQNKAQPYRLLDWDDVQALADAEGASLMVSERRVELCWYPAAQALAPA